MIVIDFSSAIISQIAFCSLRSGFFFFSYPQQMYELGQKCSGVEISCVCRAHLSVIEMSWLIQNDLM